MRKTEAVTVSRPALKEMLKKVLHKIEMISKF